MTRINSLRDMHAAGRAVARRYEAALGEDRPPLEEPGSTPAEARIEFKITAATAIAGETGRWRYDGEEQRAIKGGKYEDKPGGITTTELYSRMESNATGSGIQPNGVDISGTDYPPGFSMQPLGVNKAVVEANRVRVNTASSGQPPVYETEWRFGEPSHDDGTCT